MSENDKKKNVILWEALPEIAGGQRVCLDVLRALKEIYNISVIAPSRGSFSEAVENEGATFFELPFQSYSLIKKNYLDLVKFCMDTPAVIRNAVSIINKNNTSAIYASSTRVFPWAAMAGERASVPVIWHIHNMLADWKTKMLINFFSGKKSIKLILSDSAATGAQYRKIAERVIPVYNGVDISRFHPDNGLRNKLRREFNIPEDAVVAGTISDLIPHKGQRTFLEAMSILLKNNEKLYGIIVGVARTGFEWYEKELKDESKKKGIEKRIIFAGYRKDIETVFNGMDILVVPSYSSESFPLIILEGLACGTAILASAFSGMLEVVENGENGFLFPISDSNALASNISLLANDSKMLAQMKGYCINIARERYDMGIFDNRIREHFLSVTGN